MFSFLLTTFCGQPISGTDNLLPSQKVTILDEAEVLSIEPRFLEFVRNENKPDVLNIEYNELASEKLFLNVVDNTTRYSIICVPNINDKKTFYNVSPEFKSLFQIVKEWLKLVKREIDAERRYSELLNPKNYVEFEDLPNSNQPFTKKEIEELKEQVKQLRLHIDALSLESVQKEELKREVDVSVEKAEKEGYTKLDFKKHLIGAIIATALRLAITADNLKLVWEGVNGFIFSLKLYYLDS